MSEIIRNQNGIPFDIDNLINDVNDKADREIIIYLLNLRSTLKKSFNARSLNDIAEFLYKSLPLRYNIRKICKR